MTRGTHAGRGGRGGSGQAGRPTPTCSLGGRFLSKFERSSRSVYSSESRRHLEKVVRIQMRNRPRWGEPATPDYDSARLSKTGSRPINLRRDATTPFWTWSRFKQCGTRREHQPNLRQISCRSGRPRAYPPPRNYPCIAHFVKFEMSLPRSLAGSRKFIQIKAHEPQV